MKTLALKLHFEIDNSIKGNKHAIKIIKLWADSVFKSGYTVYITKGIWKGKVSNSFTVERYDKNLKLINDRKFLEKVRELAEMLKQKEIIITAYKTDIKTVKLPII